MIAVTRIFDLFERFKEFPDTIGKMVISSKQNGHWVKHTTKEYQDLSNYFSYGMLSLGFQKGDKIATITNNRPEWNFIDMGLAQTGMVHVPIFPNINIDDFKYILSHSDSKMVIVSSKEIYDKIKPIAATIPTIEKVISIDKIEDAENYEDIINKGKLYQSKFNSELEKIKSEISEEDLLTIIYTSGTTGLSKGVMLSHKNLLSNAIASAKIQHLDYKAKILSFLPLSHVFERMCNYKYQYKGISIYYSEGLTKIADNIKELRVEGFITVPRLLESIFEKIMSKGDELRGIKKKIFKWAIDLGMNFTPYKNHNLWYKIRLKIADKLVFIKWRKALSPNISFIGCGGAALQPRLAKIFWAAKLPIFEGYGLTETSPIISVNYSQKGNIKLGSVGPILNGVQVKIAPDGEILTKGPNVMLGYYKNPEQTKTEIDDNGWFHTGDIGSLDENNFLSVTDRKKEIFKLSNGKYVAPQAIENKMKESFYISQAIVFGENKRFAGMLVSPNFNKLKEWCEYQKIHFKDHHELLKLPKVVQHFQKEISKLNLHLSQWERVKKFRLVVDEWTHQTGELSPSLKLKRKFIMKKYNELIEKIYDKEHL